MLTLPLDSADSSPSLTGGKGHNLSILLQGGIDVPSGFVVTTLAYQDFVNKKLLAKIEATLASHEDDLDEASAIIQAEFRKQKLSHGGHIYDKASRRTKSTKIPQSSRNMLKINYCG